MINQIHCGVIASGFKIEKDVLAPPISVIGNVISLKEGLACVKTDARLQIEDNRFSGRAFFAVLMTDLDNDGKSINKEVKEDYKNQFEKLEIIDPWFRVNRKSPI